MPKAPVPGPGEANGAEQQAQTLQPDKQQISESWAGAATAYASIAMAVAAFLTIVVTAVGTYFIWSQVKLTRKAVQDTSAATEATREANIIAEKALRNSQEVAQSDLRAWVTIDLSLFSCGRNAAFANLDISVALKNIGKTPALRVGVSLAVEVRPSLVTNYGELPELEKNPAKMGSLMPGAAKEQRFGKRLELDDIKAGVAAARTVGFEPMIVVDAVVYYHTVFDAEDAPPRITSTRYHVFNTMQFGPQFLQARMAWLDVVGPAGKDQVQFVHDKSGSAYLT